MSLDKATTVAAVLNAESDIYETGVGDVDALQAQQRYGEEQAKHLRHNENRQYVDLSIANDERFRPFQRDVWADPELIPDLEAKFPHQRCRMLIIGAGFGGLQYAIRMKEIAGIKSSDLRIVDPAGGFGGTWYWNRYPGLTCDVESYSYLPLLEETGYVPKHRYAHHDEIRRYADLLATRWDLHDSAVFQTKATSLTWDEKTKEWITQLENQRGQQLTVRSQFVVLANGVVVWPKVPDVPGFLDFKGHAFHTSRWDYEFTGGSFTEYDPAMTNLKDKRVAIIGTGATSAGLVPQLAAWSKHLYVFQRTPASVSDRQQWETDPEWFRKEIATSPGWQRRRLQSFNDHFTSGAKPGTDLIQDGWSFAPTMAVVAGDPAGPSSPEEVPAYIKRLHEIDLPRLNAIRARVEAEVIDKDVARKLMPWFPTWCKRPCFHENYLQSFNRDNVTLVDTLGRGLERITSDSIVVNGTSYEVDVIVFATGYRAPTAGTPAERGNMTIVGREGISMSEAWTVGGGPATLHGILDVRFPNLILSGPVQAAMSGANPSGLDLLAKHAAYILHESEKRANNKPFAVLPNPSAAEDWAQRIMSHAARGAAMMGCTPGYYNMEGKLESIPPEQRMIMARSGIWGRGIEDFAPILEDWRTEGRMEGIEVSF